MNINGYSSSPRQSFDLFQSLLDWNENSGENETGDLTEKDAQMFSGAQQSNHQPFYLESYDSNQNLDNNDLHVPFSSQNGIESLNFQNNQGFDNGLMNPNPNQNVDNFEQNPQPLNSFQSQPYFQTNTGPFTTQNPQYFGENDANMMNSGPMNSNTNTFIHEYLQVENNVVNQNSYQTQWQQSELDMSAQINANANFSSNYYKAKEHLSKLNGSKIVNLPGMKQLTDKELISLLNDFKTKFEAIRDIYLKDCQNIGDKGLQALAEKCSSLRIIGFTNTQLTDVGMKALAEKCHDLKYVWLDNTKVTDEGVKALAAGCHNLERVLLHKTQVTEVGVKALTGKCHNLQKVWLNNTRVTDEGLKEIQLEYPKIQFFYSKQDPNSVNPGQSNANDNFSNHYHKAREGLSKLTDWSNVNLSMVNQLTDQELIFLLNECKTQFKITRSINLNDCKNISNAGIEALADNCRNLQHIVLNNTQLTDAGVQALAEKCSSLQVVRFFNTQVTDAGVKILAEKCPLLQKVRLNRTQVTDVGIQFLAKKCRNLQGVGLAENVQISRAGIEPLLELRNLEHLLIDKISISEGEVNELISKYPHINFHYKSQHPESLKSVKITVNRPESPKKPRFLQEIKAIQESMRNLSKRHQLLKNLEQYRGLWVFDSKGLGLQSLEAASSELQKILNIYQFKSNSYLIDESQEEIIRGFKSVCLNDSLHDVTDEPVLLQAMLEMKLITMHLTKRAPDYVNLDPNGYQLGLIVEFHGDDEFALHFAHLYMSENQLVRVGKGGADEFGVSKEVTGDELFRYLDYLRKNQFTLNGRKVIVSQLASNGVENFIKNGEKTKRKERSKEPSSKKGERPVLSISRRLGEEHTGLQIEKGKSNISIPELSSTLSLIKESDIDFSSSRDPWDSLTTNMLQKVEAHQNQKKQKPKNTELLFDRNLVDAIKRKPECEEDLRFLKFILDHELFALKGYQKDNVREILAAKRAGLKGFLTALDMGLGKTAVANETTLQMMKDHYQTGFKSIFIGTESTYLQSAKSMKVMLSKTILSLLKHEFKKAQDIKQKGTQQTEYEKISHCLERNIRVVANLDRSLDQSWRDVQEEFCSVTGYRSSEVNAPPKNIQQFQFKGLDFDSFLLNFDIEESIITTPKGKLPNYALVFSNSGSAKKRFESGTPFTLVVVDEAQRFNNAKTQLYKTLKDYTKKNETFVCLLSGTPLENDISELGTLLSFTGNMTASANSLTTLVKKAAESFDEESLDINTISKTFGCLLSLREVIGALSKRLKMTDPEVKRDWNGQVPKITKKKTYSEASERQKSFLQITSKSFFDRMHREKIVLVHPDFSDKNQDVLKKIQEKNSEELKTWMSESGKLSAFLPGSELSEVINRKQPTVIFVDRVKAGETLQTCFNQLYPWLNVHYMNGTLEKTKRQEMINRFNTACSKEENFVLILQLQSGSEGIDFQKGKALIMFDKQFNPQQDAQAYARILRVGTSDEKTIYKIESGTDMELREKQLRKTKRLLLNLFFKPKITKKEFLEYLLLDNGKDIDEEALNQFVGLLSEEVIKKWRDRSNPFTARRFLEVESGTSSGSENEERIVTKKQKTENEEKSSSDDEPVFQNKKSEELQPQPTFKRPTMRKKPVTQNQVVKKLKVEEMQAPFVNPNNNNNFFQASQPKIDAVKLENEIWNGYKKEMSIQGSSYRIIPIRSDNSFSRAVGAGYMQKMKQVVIPDIQNDTDFQNAHISLGALNKSNRQLHDILCDLQQDVVKEKRTLSQTKTMCDTKKIYVVVYDVAGNIVKTTGVDEDYEQVIRLVKIKNHKNEEHYDLLIQKN